MTKTDNTFTVAKGLVEGHTEGNANVLISVVVINFEIALSLDVEVKEPVGGDLMEHVIKKGDASVGVTLASAIDVDGDGNVGFFGGAGDGGSASRKFEVSGWGVFVFSWHDGCEM